MLGSRIDSQRRDFAGGRSRYDFRDSLPCDAADGIIDAPGDLPAYRGTRACLHATERVSRARKFPPKVILRERERERADPVVRIDTSRLALGALIKAALCRLSIYVAQQAERLIVQA